MTEGIKCRICMTSNLRWSRKRITWPYLQLFSGHKHLFYISMGTEDNWDFIIALTIEKFESIKEIIFDFGTYSPYDTRSRYIFDFDSSKVEPRTKTDVRTQRNWFIQGCPANIIPDFPADLIPLPVSPVWSDYSGRLHNDLLQHL